MRVLPYGERAVLLEVGSIEEVLGVHETIRSLDLDGVEDVVPAAVTVLAAFRDAPSLQAALPALKAIGPRAADRTAGELVTIPVVYDGADLGDVAEMTGLTRDEVVEMHSGTDYTVAFAGFAPGFAYLIGLDERLRVPRRPSPRTSVPGGSVAMSGGFTAVYPRSSPGGWQLLGHTETPMWDGDRERPALLGPGMRVRFEPA